MTTQSTTSAADPDKMATDLVDMLVWPVVPRERESVTRRFADYLRRHLTPQGELGRVGVLEDDYKRLQLALRQAKIEASMSRVGSAAEFYAAQERIRAIIDAALAESVLADHADSEQGASRERSLTPMDWASPPVPPAPRQPAADIRSAPRPDSEANRAEPTESSRAAGVLSPPAPIEGKQKLTDELRTWGRAIVDRAWNAAFEDESVPSTDWSDRIIDSVAAPAPDLAKLRGEHNELRRLRRDCAKQHDEICQILGKALGYPTYSSDQENFPGSTEADGVCVGEHVAESLAGEAARQLTALQQAKEEAERALRESIEIFERVPVDLPISGDVRRQIMENRTVLARGSK